MRKETNLDFEAALHRGIPGAVYIPDRERNGQMTVTVPCSECGPVEKAFHSGSKIPPLKIARSLKRRGWIISNKLGRHICPACNKKEPVMDKTDPKPKLGIVSKPNASDQARRAKRAALEWLQEAFDPEAGRYRENESDKTIAKEVGLSEAAVAAIREEYFGPIKKPKEVEMLAAEVSKIREEASAIRERANKDVTDLMKKADALDAKINALRTANGWQ